MFDMTIGAAVVSEFGTDYSTPVACHFLNRPFLQELVLFGSVAIRLLERFAYVIESISFQVLYLGTVEERYLVGCSRYS